MRECSLLAHFLYLVAVSTATTSLRRGCYYIPWNFFSVKRGSRAVFPAPPTQKIPSALGLQILYERLRTMGWKNGGRQRAPKIKSLQTVFFQIFEGNGAWHIEPPVNALSE